MDIQILASGSKGNCYRVEHAGSSLLLEAGIPLGQIREQIGFRVSGLAGVCLSHEHMDHAKAAADLMRAGVDVYCSRGTAEALRLSGHRLHLIRPRARFEIGAWSVMPFETVHDAAEPLGFVLTHRQERLLFATDTAYLRYKVPGCTVLMLECNYELGILKDNVAAGRVNHEVKRRVIKSHMSLETLCGFLCANDLSRVREIILLHLSDDSSDAARFKATVQGLTGKPVRIAPKLGGAQSA